MSSISTGHSTGDTAIPALTGDHWTETLNDGSHVLVRPIRPEDRDRESDFIKRLSPEARLITSIFAARLIPMMPLRSSIPSICDAKCASNVTGGVLRLGPRYVRSLVLS
jgi:hypothetical protein